MPHQEIFSGVERLLIETRSDQARRSLVRLDNTGESPAIHQFLKEAPHSCPRAKRAGATAGQKGPGEKSSNEAVDLGAT